jgi:hypothetical protein
MKKLLITILMMMAGIVSADPLWTPSNITVSAWYDASDSSSVLLSGSVVTNWLDKSGNNRHVSQTNSTQRPTYAAPIITFDGLTNYLINTSPFMYSAGSIDIFMVAAVVSNLDKRVVSENHTNQASTIYSPAQVSSSGNYMGGFVRNDANITAFSNTNRLSIVNVFFPSVTNLYHWRDAGTSIAGRVAGSNAVTVAYARTGVVSLNRFSIGAVGPRVSTPAGTAFLKANIGEIVIASVQSDDNRQKLEGYLAWKWGVQANLPPTHPYKNGPPTFYTVRDTRVIPLRTTNLIIDNREKR